MVVLILGITALIIALSYKSSKSLIVLVGVSFISVFGSFHVLRKANYSGFTIYNIRSEIAISLVNHKNVVLYSSLDSITHSTLAYSVIPHLKQYASPSKINFYTIDKTLERQNYLIKLGTHKVLILENKLTDFPQHVDFVLWRKNNYTEIQKILGQYPQAKIILDGSNSDRTIERLNKDIKSNSDRLYILKNNFAYVWKEE